MTIWRVGMLAVCVSQTKYPNAVETSWSPKVGGIYHVINIAEFSCDDAADGEVALDFAEDTDFEPNAGWSSLDFRPAFTAQDDAELIARIKSCKPIRIPVEV